MGLGSNDLPLEEDFPFPLPLPFAPLPAAALVAAESSENPQAATAAVDFLQMLVEIVEDNGEMRKRVYDYTEALQRETIEKAKRFEEQMEADPEEAGELEKLAFKMKNLFED